MLKKTIKKKYKIYSGEGHMGEAYPAYDLTITCIHITQLHVTNTLFNQSGMNIISMDVYKLNWL